MGTKNIMIHLRLATRDQITDRKNKEKRRGLSMREIRLWKN